MNPAKILILLIIYISILLATNGRRLRSVSKREEENLDRQHRNAICCEKKMRCCIKPAPAPIEIRAVIARCPNTKEESESSMTRLMTKPVIRVNEHSIKSFQGFDEDEPLIQSRVTKCRRKVLITLKLHHTGVINSRVQYIVIDHVYDPLTEKSVRLLNPYVIKLRQGEVSKSFFLKFVDYVNSEAYEIIYNKHDGNFTGCYANKSRSTCGVVKYDGKLIPYSEGFCCSCDAAKNAERQPESINEKNEPIISYSDPAYLLDRVQCPRNYVNEVKDKQNDTVENCTKSSTQCSNLESHPDMCTDSGTKTDTTPDLISLDLINQQNPLKRWQYSTYSSKVLPKSTPISHKYLKSEVGFKQKRQDDEIPEQDKLANSQLDDYYRRVQLHYRKKDRNSYIENLKKAHTPISQRYLDDIKEHFGDDLFSKRLIRKLRQTFPSGIQKRGRQNCADRYTPPGLDPEHYHESAHCLRFSDIWYGIYKLGNPFVEQSLWINIYERFETETSSDRWREITNQTLYLGNRNPMYEDEVPTISISFTTKTLNQTNEYEDLRSRRILIPEGVTHCDKDKYPEVKNGAPEYLVIHPEQIALEGDQCDRIGVGFEAFFKQPLRCGVPRSTCLRNQPKHLWRHDKALEKHNKKGCYYLKYHANITKEPIIVNKTTGEKFLDVEYKGGHMATIDIEIKADFNSIIRQQTTAVITEVYVDSTCDKLTRITIKIINSGLMSNQFMVQLSDFPLEIPIDFGKAKSKHVLISPQNQHVFSLEVRHPLPSELLFCSIEVLNSKHELVALRRIRIQKYDRCICTWHCLCACVASSTGLKCNPMSLEHYHAAGFQGSLPIITYMVHFTLLDDLLSVVFYFALFLLLILLLMGLLKALMSFCCHNVGMWGLPVLLDLPKRMKKYYEPNLKSEPIEYDRQGWPIHPETKQRVRNISRSTEFCTNLVFFFIYPLAGCLVIFRRLCCSYYTRNNKAPGKMRKTLKQESESQKTCSVASQSAQTTEQFSTKDKKKKCPLKKSKGKTVELNSKTESETSFKSKSTEKYTEIITTVMVANTKGGKQKKGRFSKASSKDSGDRLSKNDKGKICACDVPKLEIIKKEDKFTSTVSISTKSSTKQKKLKEKSKCFCKKASKTPPSSKTSVSSAKSSQKPRSSSHFSKSSKKPTTLTTSPMSASAVSSQNENFFPIDTSCDRKVANLPASPKNKSCKDAECPARPKSL